MLVDTRTLGSHYCKSLEKEKPLKIKEKFDEEEPKKDQEVGFPWVEHKQ